MAKPRCPICRSKRWRKDRNSGLVVCEEGHVLQGYVEEDNEAEGPVKHATRVRRLNKNKKTRKERRKADPDIYHGQRRRFLYFQIAQIVLQKQTQRLIAYWELPPEFEVVVRDLWSMYVSLTDLQPEPWVKPPKHESTDKPSVSKNALKTQEEIQDAISNPSSDSEASQGMDLSDSESDADPAELEDTPPDDKKRAASPKKTLKATLPDYILRRIWLHHTLAILYLACLTMRVPTTICEIRRLAETHVIPFLSILKELPPEMLKHLDNFHFENDFQAQNIPPVYRARQPERSMAWTVSALATLLRERFDIELPPLNAAAILYRHVRDFCLPPAMYVSARRILATLQDSLEYTVLKRSAAQSLPEISLAVAVLICIKLVWGADGQARIAQTPSDMATSFPYFEDWLKLAQDSVAGNVMTSSRHITASAQAADLDKFLDFFDREYCHDPHTTQTMLLGTLPISTEAEQSLLDRYFSTSAPGPARDQVADAERLRVENEKLSKWYSDNLSRVRPPSADGLQPGQAYPIWSSGDKQGALPSGFEAVLGPFEAYTGYPKHTLLKEMQRAEKRLEVLQDGLASAYLPAQRLRRTRPVSANRAWLAARPRGG